MQWRAAFVIAALVGCGDNLEPPMAVLGTGDDAFEAMPSELPIVFGEQDGFNIVAHVQMKGLIPGDPKNVFDPGNPKTRILSYFADTGIPLNKVSTGAFRLGYKPTDAETYEMAKGQGIIFDNCWRAEHLIGKQLRIELSLLDAENCHATDERVVTMLAPIIPGYPTGEGMPGCPQ